MDSLWRDVEVDGWELEPGEPFLKKHDVGSPLRQCELDDMAVGVELMLLVLVGSDGGVIRDRIWVRVIDLGDVSTGVIVSDLRQSYCDQLVTDQHVTFKREHVAAIRGKVPS